MNSKEQPDSGGNRYYDYITIEQHEAARKTLDEKDRFDDLTTEEIAVLRDGARQLELRKDVVDHVDRLALIRCVFYYVGDYRKLQEKFKEQERRLQKLETIFEEAAESLKPKK